MLSRINPLVLFAVCLAWILVSLMRLDLNFQLLALSIPVGLLVLVAKVPPGRIFVLAIPFVLFGTGVATTQLFFRQESGYIAAVRMESIWASDAGLVGLILFLRVLACGFLSALFVLTIDPGRFIKALMIHCRLPASFAYALMSVLNMARDIAGEIMQMRLARAMRQGKHPARVPGPIETASLIVPALAYALRRAERMALAMEARGFSGTSPRTVIHPPRIAPSDVIVLLAGLGLLALSIWLT